MDPAAFDWLDLAEQKHKAAGDRSVPDVMGSDYPTLGREYRALERMHDLAPDVAAEPLMPVWTRSDSPFRTRDVVAYYVERFDDSLQLEDALEQGRVPDPETVLADLESALTRFHGHAVPHGDLHGNVYWDEHRSRLYLIDPVGLPKDRRDETWMKTSDDEVLAHYRDVAGIEG